MNSTSNTIENYSVEIIPSKRKTIKKTKVILSGKLTIENILLIKESLLSVFETYDFVDIVLEKVDQIDLTIIQLLHAINTEFTAQNKSITLKSNFSDEINQLITNAGFRGMFQKVTKTI